MNTHNPFEEMARGAANDAKVSVNHLDAPPLGEPGHNTGRAGWFRPILAGGMLAVVALVGLIVVTGGNDPEPNQVDTAMEAEDGSNPSENGSNITALVFLEETITADQEDRVREILTFYTAKVIVADEDRNYENFSLFDRSTGMSELESLASVAGTTLELEVDGSNIGILHRELADEPGVLATASEVDGGEGPWLNDHWHKAYGIYVCGQWQPNSQSDFDPEGLHSHQDGVIHMHPFSTNATRSNATLGLFLEALFMDIDDAALTSSDIASSSDFTTTNGLSCDGQPATLSVAIWDAAPGVIPTGAPDRIVTENLANIVFEQDGGALAIAYLPEGTEIPVPPSAEMLPIVGADPSTGQTTGPGFDPTDPLAPTGPVISYIPVTTNPGELEGISFQPVLEETLANASAPPSCVPDADIPSVCYILSEQYVDNSAVASAEAVNSDGNNWFVNLVFTDDGIVDFNELAFECSARSEQCPTGLLAIVLNTSSGSSVLSSPTVNAPKFEADQITISGNFTEEETTDLADTINQYVSAN